MDDITMFLVPDDGAPAPLQSSPTRWETKGHLFAAEPRPLGETKITHITCFASSVSASEAIDRLTAHLTAQGAREVTA